jgi:hypothetical protein
MSEAEALVRAAGSWLLIARGAAVPDRLRWKGAPSAER